MPDEPKRLDATKPEPRATKTEPPETDGAPSADAGKRTVTVRCPDCRSRYEINSAAARPALRVRCPRCKAVFPVPAPPPPAGTVPAPRPPREPVKITDPRLARRLARNMLSEIVLNRPGERERARERGSLLSAFGPAVIEAYRMYAGKVSPGLETSRGIFRDAVNEILGDGILIL
jgi:predicted Zn finger-like uncharacterized protein